ncbi:hypothetical protein KFK09_011235 [Dendrobium nobile]|uniref:Uncharacterized protein n=1 Tax=Dendrobium nobile TaxID=94219 RepID=A0A8T3BEC0_DENNO|nr:hypothetical protein KFK09_011235 [Dendrobium nobile]
MCSRFLYFGNINLRKLHSIYWKDTCVPKSKGGLGITSIDSLYYNFACSIIWRCLSFSSLLFDSWRSKYQSLWKPMIVKCYQYWKHLRDRNVPLKLKGKFYKMAVRPAMIYGAECWQLKEKHNTKLSVGEMGMLRWMSGFTLEM